jgi:hypothetical protein
MPFVLLAAGLSLNLAYRGMVEKIEAVKPGDWLRSFDFWPAAVILGGLSFLNTWDFPIYVVLFAAVYTWLRTSQLGWSRARIGDFLKTGLMLGAAGGVLYLPFYIGFSSQAGGLLPSLAFQTRGVYFLIMFLPLLLPILIWLAGRVRGIAPQSRKTGILVSAGLGLTLFILMTAVGGLFLAARQIGQVWQQNGGSLASRGGQVVSAVTAFFNTQGGDGADLLMEALVRRAASPVTWLAHEADPDGLNTPLLAAVDLDLMIAQQRAGQAPRAVDTQRRLREVLAAQPDADRYLGEMLALAIEEPGNLAAVRAQAHRDALRAMGVPLKRM